MGGDSILNKNDGYSLAEIRDFIVVKLQEKAIVYEIKEESDLIHIYIDKLSNFVCSICALDIKVGHLKGYLCFNLDEGKDHDLLSMQKAVEHIMAIINHDLYQVETYKFHKLCCVKQYQIIDDKKVFCSGLWILHFFYFLPFVKKEVKEVCYNFINGKFQIRSS